MERVLGSPANNIGTAMPALVTGKPTLPKPYETLFERPERAKKGRAGRA
jgi:DNA-directed RNA polymerase III subunit RPC1